jgi:hypothetical protein
VERCRWTRAVGLARGLAAAAALLGGACHAEATPAVASEVDGESADDSPEDPGDTLPVAAPSKLALVDEARRELAAVKESHYAHRTRVDEAAGTFDYDCSGFVGYALSRSAPAALAAITAATRPRPLARHFEAFFEQPRAPWTRVDRADALVPGDVIAWLEPAEKHTRNTGHVMIVAAPPRAGARTGELVVDVIDSSHSGHGAADARRRTHTDGLGTGALVLLVAADGRAVGYRWSTWKKSIAYRTRIALGHLPS